MADRRRGWIGSAAGLVVLAGVAAYLARPAPPLEVDIVEVGRGEVREVIPAAAAGTVEPSRRVTVRAEIAGTVSAVHKRRGERVDAGGEIVVFKAEELGARLAQAEANLEAAEVAMKMAKSARETAARALQRAKKLQQGGAISEVQLEKAQTEWVALDHRVAQAEAARKQARAAVRLATVTTRRATVTAPFGGVLQDVLVDVGVQLAPGAPLFDLIDDASVHIVLPVDESDIARIAVGQRVTLRTDAARGEALSGEVRFIPPAVGRSSTGPSLEAVSSNRRERSVYVEVTPANPDRFRVGASVNAEFLVTKKSDVLYVPSHAVIGRGVQREVYVVRNKRARRVPFTPGLTSWERTEILEGLELAEPVITNLNDKALEDGVRVRIGSTEPSPRDSASARVE